MRILIRIRTGNRWKSDPKLRGPLAHEEAWDAFGIEVDGVDVSAGLLEGRLLPTFSTLVQALTELAAGDRRIRQISFASGVVLLLERRGDHIRLNLVHLRRPARVVARDLEVDFEAFGEAAVESAQGLLASLSQRYPHAATLPKVRAFAQGLEGLLRSLPLGDAGPEEAPQAAWLRGGASEGGSPTFGFDLRDEEGKIAGYQEGDGLAALLVWGHVYLHGPDGEELLTVAGMPFLLLRDLASLASRLVDPRQSERQMRLPLGHEGPEIVMDLDASRLTVAGRTLQVRAVDFAQSILTSALDFVGVLLARNQRLAANPYLADLQDEARGWLALIDDVERAAELQAPAPTPGPGPARAPIGTPPIQGDLRKVAWRKVWETELGSIRSFLPVGGGAWALHTQGATYLSLQGGRGRSIDEAVGVCQIGQEGSSLALLAEGELLATGPEGEERWRRPAAIHSLQGAAHVLGDVAWLIGDRRTPIAVELADGTPRFHFEPPAAHRAVPAFSSSLLALAADNGMLYAFDLDRGEVAWRLPALLSAVAVGPAGIWGIADGAQGLELLCIDVGDRGVRTRTPLPIETAGILVPASGGVVLTGAGSRGGEVLQVGADGKIAWRARPILGPGAPWITQAGAALFARGSRGVARIEAGKVRWSAPCGPGGPAQITQGLVVLPGERLSIRDARTGREVLTQAAAQALPAADYVAVGAGGELAVCDIHGSCAGLRLSGGLAVV